MSSLDIDCFAIFEDKSDSTISNVITECQDCKFKADSEFRKKDNDWELSYLACHFIFKRCNTTMYPEIRKAQEYFASFGEIIPRKGTNSAPVIISFDPHDSGFVPKFQQPGVSFILDREEKPKLEFQDIDQKTSQATIFFYPDDWYIPNSSALRLHYYFSVIFVKSSTQRT